jgi:hypothetical protein
LFTVGPHVHVKNEFRLKRLLKGRTVPVDAMTYSSSQTKNSLKDESWRRKRRKLNLLRRNTKNVLLY